MLRVLLTTISCTSAALCLAGYGVIWGDAATLGLLPVVTGGPPIRWIGLFSAAFLTVAAYPPLEWPTAAFCLSLAFPIWRSGNGHFSVLRESFAFGFIIGWWAAPYMGDPYGQNQSVVEALGASILGLQFALIGLAASLTRNCPIYISAGLAAILATAIEMGRVYALNMPLLLLAQGVVNLPIAQLASSVTIFGVSALLYQINFLLCPGAVANWDIHSTTWRREWIQPALAVVILLSTCISGWALGHSLDYRSFPLDVLIVQPHVNDENVFRGIEPEKLSVLRELTDKCVKDRRRQGLPPPQLIIWPEFAVGLDANQSGDLRTVPAKWFIDNNWSDAILFGVIIRQSKSQQTNSALLFDEGGLAGRYDKRVLVPFVEAKPEWIENGRLANFVGSFFQAQGKLKPGTVTYRPLEVLINCYRIHLGISICYELHLPHLVQYTSIPRPDLFVHLTDEQWFAKHPQLLSTATIDAQYRAIETRTWQVVCSNWGRSAIIRPDGEICAILGIETGVIDSRQLKCPRDIPDPVSQAALKLSQ